MLLVYTYYVYNYTYFVYNSKSNSRVLTMIRLLHIQTHNTTNTNNTNNDNNDDTYSNNADTNNNMLAT